MQTAQQASPATPLQRAIAGAPTQKLIVRPWFCHAATTIGYVADDGEFVPVAECSTGPELAASYEPLALVLAAAPELLVALKLMTGWDKPVGPGTPEWDSAIAAIAKAEGCAA